MLQYSADYIRRVLSENRIDTGSFRSEHLGEVYRRLNRIPSAPQFQNHFPFLDQPDYMPSPVSDEITGLIVETRKVECLNFVIENFMANTGLRVHLFVGLDNAEILASPWFRDKIQKKRLFATIINSIELPASSYNALFMSEVFWSTFVGRRKVFIFQTDSLICSDSNFALHNFLDYDYIGPWWQPRRPVGLVIGGGVGGFSIRNYELAIEVLRRFDPRLWVGGEDGYFAFHMDLIGARVARGEPCKQFATQHTFSYRSYGVHKMSCLSSDEQIAFVRYCPDVSKIIW